MNSMTGFGAASATLRNLTLSVEISGVNRKQTEIIVNLPRNFSDLEPRVRETAAAAVVRGRVSISVSLAESKTAGTDSLTLHTDKFHALCQLADQLRSSSHHEVSLSMDTLVRLGIVTNSVDEPIPSDEVWESALKDALHRALHAFREMRAREGKNLREDLLHRVDTLCGMREDMMRQAADVPRHYRDQLLKRLKEQELPIELHDERIIKEIALFADRCDVSEEMTRLASHLEQFRSLCRSEESVGRTLDFLCQEIFRELNTTGSKANHAELAQTVVFAKTELEKIREQVQNVE